MVSLQLPLTLTLVSQKHAHDVETCIPGNSIRFADRLTSGYGCSCQFASHWGIPCRHRLHLLFQLDIHLTVSDINSSYLIQETQTDNAPGTYESQKPPTPPHGSSLAQQLPKVTVAVLDNITSAMNRLAIQAKGVTKQVQMYFLYHNLASLQIYLLYSHPFISIVECTIILYLFCDQYHLPSKC